MAHEKGIALFLKRARNFSKIPFSWMAHEKGIGEFLFLKRALRETFFSPPKISSEIFFLKRVWLKKIQILTQTFLFVSQFVVDIFDYNWRRKRSSKSCFKIKFSFSWMAHEKGIGEFFIFKASSSRNFLFAAKNFIRNFFKVWLKNFKFLTQTFLCCSICSRYFRLQLVAKERKRKRNCFKNKFSPPFSWMAHEKGIGEFFIFKASSSRNFLFAAKKFHQKFF